MSYIGNAPSEKLVTAGDLDPAFILPVASGGTGQTTGTVAFLGTVQSFTAVQTPKYSGAATVSTTSDFVFNPSTHGQTALVTLTNAVTVTLRVSAGTIVAGTHYSLILKAGDTSARTFAYNTSEVKVAGGSALPITSGAIVSGAWDVLHLIGIDTNSVAVVGSAASVR